MFKQPLILKPSFLLTAFLIFVHFGAVIAIAGLSLNWLVIVAISILVLLSLIYTIRRYALQLGAKAIIKCWLNNEEEWLLQNRNDHVFTAKLAESSFRSRYLVILNFSLLSNNKKITVIILPDSLSNEAFRSLRSALLFQ